MEPSARPSFLAPASDLATGSRGWRKFAQRLGITIKPSAAERQRAEWTSVVARQWAGCRTIAIANGKGGVGKTMTTAMLSAVYAREGGGNVLAWDNDTRGTLGWRTERRPVRHDAARPPARGSPPARTRRRGPDITRFVHHQAADRYDVLRSNPSRSRPISASPPPSSTC